MHPTIQEVLDLIADIEAKIEEFRQAINKILAQVPDYLSWIGDRIHDGWDYLMGELDKFWDEVTRIVSYVGDPIGLEAARRSWQENVGALVAPAANSITTGQLEVDDNWEGRGADQYKQKLPDQKTAADAVSGTYVSSFASGLQGISNAIVIFWAAVAAALAVLIGAIIGGIASTATIFGAPATPFIIGGGVLVAIAAIGTATVNLTNAVMSAETSFDSIAVSGHTTWPAFALP